MFALAAEQKDFAADCLQKQTEVVFLSAELCVFERHGAFVGDKNCFCLSVGNAEKAVFMSKNVNSKNQCY